MAARCGDMPGFLVSILVFTLASCAHTVPELTRGGFIPLGGDAHEVLHGDIEDVDHNLSDHLPNSFSKGKNSSKMEPQPRLGTTVTGGDIELGITLTAPFLNIPLTTGAHQYEGTIGHLVPGAYAPLKYDLGGLVLAGALAIGSALLLPKVIPFANNPEEIFNHGGYPNHGRVDDLNKLKNTNETENKFSSIWSRLDENLLSNYNIDMTSCAQRVICSAVHTARDGISNGKPTVMDSFIHMLTEMPILRAYIPSSWRDIADVAWSADNISKQNIACDDANMHKRCPVNPEMAKMLFRTLAPNIGIV